MDSSLSFITNSQTHTQHIDSIVSISKFWNYRIWWKQMKINSLQWEKNTPKWNCVFQELAFKTWEKYKICYKINFPSTFMFCWRFFLQKRKRKILFVLKFNLIIKQTEFFFGRNFSNSLSFSEKQNSSLNVVWLLIISEFICKFGFFS